MLRSGNNIGQPNGKSGRNQIRRGRKDCLTPIGQKWEKYVVHDLLSHVVLMELDVIIVSFWHKLF
jgi:hypothetical protein